MQLPGLADLGDQRVARVARALLRVEHARRAPREAVLLPAAEAAGERRDVLVAELLERARGERRARARLAGEDDRRREIGDEALDARLEVAARDVHGAVDRALVELVRLAHVDEDGRLVGGEAGGSFSGADLVDLRLHLGEKILVAGTFCERYVHPRLFRRAYPALRGSRGIDRKRAVPVAVAGALVVAVAVVGALRAAQPGARSGARARRRR